MVFPFGSSFDNGRRGSRPSLIKIAHIPIMGGSGATPTDTENGQKERPWCPRHNNAGLPPILHELIMTEGSLTYQWIINYDNDIDYRQNSYIVVNEERILTTTMTDSIPRFLSAVMAAWPQLKPDLCMHTALESKTDPEDSEIDLMGPPA